MGTASDTPRLISILSWAIAGTVSISMTVARSQVPIVLNFIRLMVSR